MYIVQIGDALFGPFDGLAAAERWAAPRPGAWARPVSLPSMAGPIDTARPVAGPMPPDHDGRAHD